MAEEKVVKEEVVVKEEEGESKETGTPTIKVEVGNIEPIKVQFLQALNNQLGVIIELLKEIKDKK